MTPTMPPVEPLVPLANMIPLPRWWQWRERHARAFFLRKMAKMQIRVMLNGRARLACTVEQAYLMTLSRGGAHAVGAAWLQILSITADGGTATIELCAPLEGGL